MKPNKRSQSFFKNTPNTEKRSKVQISKVPDGVHARQKEASSLPDLPKAPPSNVSMVNFLYSPEEFLDEMQEFRSSIDIQTDDPTLSSLQNNFENATTNEIDWSEVDAEMDKDDIFDYSDFYWRLEELINKMKYDKRPELNMRKMRDFNLTEDEQNGILSFRMISTGLSCLDEVPRLHKYVFSKLTLRQLNLTNVVTLMRHRYLRHIDLSHNCLTDVSCLSSCPFLIHLDVSYNLLTDLLNFDPPYYLTHVHYERNEIKVIPDLKEFWSIVSLNLANNQIVKMEGLESLRFLKNLNLSDNKIERIEGISNLRIEDLDLRNNCISSFMEDYEDTEHGFKTMPCLRYVNVSKNKLTTLKLFVNASNLCIANVSDNDIDDLLELGYFQNDSCLIYVNLTGNPINKLPGYRELCIQSVRNITFLDDILVDVKEKVAASCIFSPSLWVCALNKHATFNFCKYINCPEINLTTVPYDRASTPIIMLVGPEAATKDLIYKFCRENPKHTYYVQLHTTRWQVFDRFDTEATFFYVNRQKFNEMLQDDEFLCVYHYLGHSYGFSHNELVNAIRAKAVAIVSGDVTAALVLRMSGLNPTLIKATARYPEMYRRWLQSKYETHFWDVMRPKNTALLLARKEVLLTPDSDHTVRQARDIYYDFTRNVIELEHREICCDCTCDCLKFFKHVKDWVKFLDLQREWSYKQYVPTEDEAEEFSYEKLNRPDPKITESVLDYIAHDTEEAAKMYDDLHQSNPGLFTDSIFTDNEYAAFEKLKFYVKKTHKDYQTICREAYSEIPKDDVYVNMIHRRINQILKDLNISENTALEQRQKAMEYGGTEKIIPKQLNPTFDEIIEKFETIPRLSAKNLPENSCPSHLSYSVYRAFNE